MRTFLVTILTALILACPFVCGATENGHDSHREHATGGVPSGPSPGHCPEEDDDCVCRGAVQSSDVRVPHPDSIGLPLSLYGLPGSLPYSLAHSLAHLTFDGTPTGLAGWGDSLAVRAFLQNFRC